MCLAVPGKIIKIQKQIATVDLGDFKKNVMLDLLPEAKLNDYVLVHAGFAISKMNRKEAQKTLKLFAAIYETKQ
ncbi:MAG: HypC/HybG/HupF family hydrogenase formation chaperone [Candidatus Firestonebacteria bacterium]|nr:HypC/HybG/HupF family hydrogenase formation chaperone [Candidatus Firestonebacteria bacterium]